MYSWRVPPYVYGSLKIVGIQDIGPIGSHEGDPEEYYWPFYVRGAWLILPLALVALLFRRRNRTRDAWLVLFPALMLQMLGEWILQEIGLTRFLGFVCDSAVLFLFAMGFLWLLSYKLAYLSRLKAVAYAVCLIVLAGVIALPGISYMDITASLMPSVLAFGALAVATLLAMSLAGRACRKRFTSLRYVIWFFVVLVPGIGGVLMALISFWELVPRLLNGSGISLHYIYGNLEDYVKVGLFAGSILFAFMLPFLALALWSPTYRERFHAIFRLPGMNYEEENDLTGRDDPPSEP